jgi:hypothetical protein
MTSALAEPGRREARRWWGLVALVFVAQLGVVFWLGERSPALPRPHAAGLNLRLLDNNSSHALLLALRDPTRFVLPHGPDEGSLRRLNAFRPEAPAYVWADPTNYAPPALDQPSVAFTRFVASNAFDAVHLPPPPAPPATVPRLSPAPAAGGQSTVRVTGDLAQRRLTTPLQLPCQTNVQILKESVVRLLVGADGLPRSTTLISSCGLAEADLLALQEAQAARFEALPASPLALASAEVGNLTRGQMIFSWYTIPLQATNVSLATP